MSEGQQDTEQRNVVLVTADSVRADHCGFVNDSADTTPFLDSMAEKGVVFTDAIAPGPRTPSSMPEIFTGEPMTMPETSSIDWEARTSRISNHLSRHQTIAQRFKNRGYSTAAYTANPFTNEVMNYDLGFDEFNEIRHESTDSLISRFSGTPLKPVVYLSQWLNKDNWFSQWPSFYDELIETVADLEEPYFLWVFLLDTHTPYVVPKADRQESSTVGMYSSLLRGSSAFGEGAEKGHIQRDLSPGTESRIKKAYRDTIRSVDRFMSSLWEDLHQDDPLFAFHSDHGEAFDEHGVYGHQPHLYEENLHVPFILYNAGIQAVFDGQVSVRDLPGIITSYSGGDHLSESEITHQYVFSKTEDGQKVSVRSHPLKYISSPESEEIYELSEDPNEQYPRSKDRVEGVAELIAQLESHVEGLRGQNRGSSENATLDQNIKNRLKSLGYRE